LVTGEDVGSNIVGICDGMDVLGFCDGIRVVDVIDCWSIVDILLADLLLTEDFTKLFSIFIEFDVIGDLFPASSICLT
jgi:hypothetical protein